MTASKTPRETARHVPAQQAALARPETVRRIAAQVRRPLAAALLVALIAPGLAFAQTAKEKELEARIAQLEQQVQALLSSQQQQQTAISETQAQVTEVKTAQAQTAPADGKPRIQTSPIMTAANPNTAFSYGGFIKMDAMATDTSDGRIADGSSGRLFYVPSAIPVGADDADGGDPTPTTMRSSRASGSAPIPSPTPATSSRPTSKRTSSVAAMPSSPVRAPPTRWSATKPRPTPMPCRCARPT